MGGTYTHLPLPEDTEGLPVICMSNPISLLYYKVQTENTQAIPNNESTNFSAQLSHNLTDYGFLFSINKSQ